MAVKWEGVTKFVAHTESVVQKAKTFDMAVVTTIAEQSKKIVLDVARADVPNLTLSRFARGKPLKLDAHVLAAPRTPATAAVFPTPPGPWYMLDHGGKAHKIGIRVAGAGARKGQRNQAGFLGNAALGFAAMGPVNHPAFQAKHTWDKGEAAAVAAGSKLFQGALTVRYYEMFRG